MAHSSARVALSTMVALCLLVSACSRGTNPPPVVADFQPVLDDALHLEPTPRAISIDPSVTIASPADSAIVSSPLPLTINVVAPEPDAEEREVHVFIDEPCAPAGDSVVVDQNRYNLDAPIGVLDIELEDGFHTLCVQVMNPASARSTAATATVSVAVVPADTLANDEG